MNQWCFLKWIHHASNLELFHDMILHGSRIHSLLLHVELALIELVQQDLGPGLIVLLRRFYPCLSRGEVKAIII